MLRAFDELGIPVDAIGGTSIGALVAAGKAFGMSWKDMVTQFPPMLTRGFMNVTLPVVSLLSAGYIVESLHSVVGDLNVEDLSTPLFCVATNLTRGGEVVLRQGSVILAVRASTSIPGVFPPVPFGGDLLVDGGVANNVPIDPMLALYSGRVRRHRRHARGDRSAVRVRLACRSHSSAGWKGRRDANASAPSRTRSGCPTSSAILVRSAAAASQEPAESRGGRARIGGALPAAAGHPVEHRRLQVGSSRRRRGLPREPVVRRLQWPGGREREAILGTC